MTSSIIEIKNLTYKYKKDVDILKNISLSVPKGSIYGFLGQNGAGKSTTMRLITGLLSTNENSIKVFDQNILENQSLFSKIGCIIDSPIFYPHLNAWDHLLLLSKWRNLPSKGIVNSLKLVALENHAKKKVQQFSLGMKQRLAIAMTLISEPELLILDEPVNGLDPGGIIDIRNLLLKINQEQGTTILISSHLLSEIEKMCTHIGIIHQGAMKFEGKIESLYKIQNQTNVTLKLEQPEIVLQSLLKRNIHSLIIENEIHIQIKDKKDIPVLIKHLVNEGALIYEIKMTDGLEERFGQLIQNS